MTSLTPIVIAFEHRSDSQSTCCRFDLLCTYTKRDNSTMAKDDNDGNGSLIVGMIILGAAVCVMIYCGIRQMLEDLPRYVVRDRTPEQISYMRDVRQRNLHQAWCDSRSISVATDPRR
ncbi:hypothetical protein AFLA_006404 [Aspergillus flavus NRRL3357]|nr:hypothetical protein AFLA_006404 [Aspergillus flavus NRRL3357]